MLYHGVATVLYFTAFVTNAATVTPFYGWYYNNLAAAAVSHYWSSLTHTHTHYNNLSQSTIAPAVFLDYNVQKEILVVTIFIHWYFSKVRNHWLTIYSGRESVKGEQENVKW